MRWFRRKEQELQREIESHLAMAAQDRIERGESPEQAAQKAKSEFGNVALIAETTRETWKWAWLEHFSQDVRYGVRMFAKTPAYTAIAILTLALGIGANTALFSVVNGVLLNPLPFPDPNQLVIIHESKPNFDQGSISFPNFLDWQRDNKSFSAMGVSRGYAFILTGLGDAEQVNADFVSSGFFPALGLNPILGRSFLPGEDQVGAAPIVMISEGFWRRKFGARPDVLGRVLTLDAKNYTIVGVVPASFHGGIAGIRERELYAPVGQWSNPILMNRGAGLGFHGVGRLNPGVSLKQAQADMNVVTQNLAAAYPDVNNGVGSKLAPLKEQIVGDVQPYLFVLLAAVGCVLLIACVNVANLLLARANGRTQELAVRVSLGASRARLIRQLLTESCLLALAGGCLGFLIAAWGTHTALKILPVALPRADNVGIDSRVLIFTTVLSILAGILFGLVPALKVSRPDLHETLKQGGRGGSGVRHSTQSVLVVTETALALVLLVGAGLMLRSLAGLWKVDPGFDPENVVTFGLSLPPTTMNANPDAIRAAFREFDQRLRAVPGVTAVSQSWGAVPISSDDEQLFLIEGQPKPASDKDMNWAIGYIVEPEYQSAMKVPLLRGRFLSEQDNEHSPRVVVIDDVLAAKHFPHEDPIGKRIQLQHNQEWAQIVGVVGHVKQWGLETDDTESVRAQLYIPCMQMPDEFIRMTPSGSTVLVRSDRMNAGLIEAVRNASREMSSQQVIFGVETMNGIISESLSTRRFSMILFGIFAAVALLLATVGMYGVISFLVGQRTHEIGVRMALGAERGDVLRLVLAQGAKMAGWGIAIGFVSALLVMPLLANLLFSVRPADPVTLVTVAVLLSGVAMLACYLPARRALGVDCMAALRYE
ncbi:MAG TPA: ABC transporter permease [Terriglobales bacterium]|jgi:predicted permease